MFRLAANFLFGGAWVLLFSALGWMRLARSHQLVSDPILGRLLEAAVIALVIVAVGEAAAFCWSVFVVATLGLGCIMLPVYWLLVGYVKLLAASWILPGWFAYRHDLLFVLLMSWILGSGRWHLVGEMRRERS